MPYKDRNNPKWQAYITAYRATHKAERRAYYLAHREELLAASHARYAAKQDAIKAQVRAYRKANPEKVNTVNTRWRRANPGAGKATQQAWNARHRDQLRGYTRTHHARKRGAAISDYTDAQWPLLLAHFGNRCVWCPHYQPDCLDCPAGTHALELDHIVPVSKWGNHTLSNLAPACRGCNARKNKKPAPIPITPLVLP